MTRHFLSLLDWTPDEILHLLREATRLKQACQRGEREPLLAGRVLGMIFEKPSLRTRVSFETGMAHLGGTALFLSGQDVGLGVRESIADFARVISQYVDGVVLRTFSHATVESFAAHASCPVINGLSDHYHPCQALGDMLTIWEVFGDVAGKTVAFVGDGNNVARSLAIACGKLGARFVLAAPKGYGFDEGFLTCYRQQVPDGAVVLNGKPDHAVRDADVIYTDVWTSMGQEAEREKRLKKFANYQLNAKLLSLAPPHARVMHCLPAHRGEEITDDVLDGDRSIVIQQAANRMHAQKALLVHLLGRTS
ncbi:MAG: ornithine carbamoyltransferase [Gemmataceae bacterium]